MPHMSAFGRKMVSPAAAETNRRREDDRASYEDTHGNLPFLGSLPFPGTIMIAFVPQESCGAWDTGEPKRAAGSSLRGCWCSPERRRVTPRAKYKTDDRTVGLVPFGSSARKPALLPCHSVSYVEGRGE